MDIFILVPVLRIVLGLLFTISALLKLPALRAFAVIVAAYGVLPRALVKPAAYLQPFVELAIGLWILSGQYLPFSSLASVFLMLAANYFVFSAYLHGKRLANCGCYGVTIKSPLDSKKLVENIIIMLLTLLLVAFS